MNSQKLAKTAYPINSLIAERWSPYAYSDRPVTDEELRSLFEAARWAPSSYNEQPWAYIVAKKSDGPAFNQLLSCLVEGNQAWAAAVPVLAIGCSRLRFSHNGKPNTAALHDLGLASANLSIEATARGISVHQMIGIVPDKVRVLYALPEDVQPLTGIAIGYSADPSSAAEKLRDRDLAERQRKSIGEFVFSGKFGDKAAFV